MAGEQTNKDRPEKDPHKLSGAGKDVKFEETKKVHCKSVWEPYLDKNLGNV